MDAKLNITGIFSSEEELAETVQRRKICYDIEPYYVTHKGDLVQIGYQINLYGTFPKSDKKPSPDDHEFRSILRDVRKIAEALSNTCDPLHMCDSTVEDSNEISYSHDRKMRPDVTVHVPVFDQQNFGHPVDRRIEETVGLAGRILEAAGVRRKRWED
ncbi:MAG TPA: hypothetical protein VEP69_06855 [Thermodesulfovibrionales bacterium]|nr:hypothetical protein [Thermodesulfovibrionales bacterium]